MADRVKYLHTLHNFFLSLARCIFFYFCLLHNFFFARCTIFFSLLVHNFFFACCIISFLYSPHNFFSLLVHNFLSLLVHSFLFACCIISFLGNCLFLPSSVFLFNPIYRLKKKSHIFLFFVLEIIPTGNTARLKLYLLNQILVVPPLI